MALLEHGVAEVDNDGQRLLELEHLLAEDGEHLVGGQPALDPQHHLVVLRHLYIIYIRTGHV
eukprot:2865746-Pyramimonas_sp.AAC.2